MTNIKILHMSSGLKLWILKTIFNNQRPPQKTSKYHISDQTQKVLVPDTQMTKKHWVTHGTNQNFQLTTIFDKNPLKIKTTKPLSLKDKIFSNIQSYKYFYFYMDIWFLNVQIWFWDTYFKFRLH